MAYKVARRSLCGIASRRHFQEMKMPQTILQNIFGKKLCKNGKTPSADRGTRLQRALYGVAVFYS